MDTMGICTINLRTLKKKYVPIMGNIMGRISTCTEWIQMKHMSYDLRVSKNGGFVPNTLPFNGEIMINPCI